MADLLDTIKGYRYKETLPTYFNTKSVMQLAQALPTTNITPAQLLNRILLEGRSDAGVNGFDKNNKASVDNYNVLRSRGYSELGAAFSSVVKEKQAVATRKISLLMRPGMVQALPQ